MNDNTLKTEQDELAFAQPQVLPKPTYMPFLLAFSLLLIGWGMLSTWIMSAAGGIGFCIAIYGWIKELIHEQPEESEP